MKNSIEAKKFVGTYFSMFQLTTRTQSHVHCFIYIYYFLQNKCFGSNNQYLRTGQKMLFVLFWHKIWNGKCCTLLANIFSAKNHPPHFHNSILRPSCWGYFSACILLFSVEYFCTVRKWTFMWKLIEFLYRAFFYSNPPTC